MKARIRNVWEALRSSFWFIPSSIIVLLVSLAYLTQMIDERYRIDIAVALPGVFRGGPDGAREMLSTIAGSMMTAAAVTFSITIAALANASSQFGPRLLRVFMRDTVSQVVLGTFVGTFVYCLFILRQIPSTTSEQQVPHFATTIAFMLALVSIGVLIYFIHHLASLLQVSNVAARVGEELQHAIRSVFPEHVGRDAEFDSTQDAIPLSEAGGQILPDADQQQIVAHRIGYIQAIDHETLMGLAVEHDVVFRIELRPGRFIVPDSRLAVVWPADRATEDLEAALQKVFLVGSLRTHYQDIELYFDELTEIALRAMSPGINDPYTAIICIDWLTGGLTTLARRRMPSRYRYDSAKKLRVIADSPSLEHLVDTTFDRIRNVSTGHPAVLLKLIDAIKVIAENSSHEGQRDALRRQLRALDSVIRGTPFVEHERRRLRSAYRETIHGVNGNGT